MVKFYIQFDVLYRTLVVGTGSDYSGYMGNENCWQSDGLLLVIFKKSNDVR